MGEEWRPVAGYEGIYEVSSLGHVRRIVAGAGDAGRREIRRAPYPDGGSFQVVLSAGGKPKTRNLARLVATAFLGPRPSDTRIRYLDGDRSNVAASNLAWDDTRLPDPRPGEEWRPVVGYESLYEVSNLGHVRKIAGCELRRFLTREHRYAVHLCFDGDKTTCYIAILVANAFLGHRPKRTGVRYLDGDTTNTALSNLAWRD